MVDLNGYAVSKVVGLGRLTVETFTELFDEHLDNPSFICADGNKIYKKYCDLKKIPLYAIISKMVFARGDRNMEFRNFNGYLMSRDTCLAKIENGQICEIFHQDLLPIYLQRTGNLENWLKRRAIDSHRIHSRLLKKALRLKEKDDVSTVLSVNAVTLTDTYWMKETDSELMWENVRFSKDTFAELALNGELTAFELEPNRTPELTNIGSFEKCWKVHDGIWWLYKKQSELEVFSETFISLLGKELGFAMAVYEPGEGYIKSLDFTRNASVNYEAAYGWMGENEDYIENYRCFAEMGDDFADRYVELILMDSFCRNADRHTENYGILRDVETGEALRLAPNFDNNIALLYNGYSETERKPDLFGRLLHELEDETKAISIYLSRNPKPVITDEMVERCIQETGFEVDKEYVKRFIKIGYEQTPLMKNTKVIVKPVASFDIKPKRPKL